jgi:hypothetical protein
MRLWSLNPSYLDTKGIVALWREGLLARAVLRGATKGYRHHPQLIRFRELRSPVSAINQYLSVVADEADARNYRFDRTRIGPVRVRETIPVAKGQVAFETVHLRRKLKVRSPESCARLPSATLPAIHPLFSLVEGEVEAWESGQ